MSGQVLRAGSPESVAITRSWIEGERRRRSFGEVARAVSTVKKRRDKAFLAATIRTSYGKAEL